MDVFSSGCLIAPSLICLDHCDFGRQVKLLEQSGAEVLHVDILDGHFSPSMPLGLETVRQLRKATSLPFDAHIMVTCGDYFIGELLDIGVSQLTFHVEYAPHLDHTINMIKKAGVRAGVALKPSTPLSTLDYALEKLDSVLLMLINPGYASHPGEAQAPYASRKIEELHERITSQGLNVKVELDGRVSREDIERYSKAELADIFVVGTTCLKQGDLSGSMKSLAALQTQIRKGVCRP